MPSQNLAGTSVRGGAAASQLSYSDPSAVADGALTAHRKADHLRINVEEDVAAKGIGSGFEAYRFVHQALPEIDLDEVDLTTELFGRRLRAPILISCMTGGTAEAGRINLALAEVAQQFGLAMGLGSGRVLLERPEVLPTFQVRRVAPTILLFCNLGAVQLNRGLTSDDCRRLIDQTQADALVLHLNALQEALQPEGDTWFRGLLAKIRTLCRDLDVPVVAKEVGWGLAPELVDALLDAGVAAVDVAGTGGTSWSEVERYRLAEPWRARVAAAFADWGIPTAEAITAARRAAPTATIFASGGIGSGIDVAKALALGADLVGIAGPFLRAATEPGDAAASLARELIETLRIAMFCLGARAIRDLQQTPHLIRTHQPSARLHRERLAYSTTGGGQFIDITRDVAAVVERSGIQQGFVHVYSHHTTAAIRVNENEPLLLRDFQRVLGMLVPPGGFEHDDLDRRVGVSPSEPRNGHAHCRHLMLASSETIPVVDGRMALGRWQSVFLIELCSARRRQLTVQVTGE
ncbi:MAG TPA: type 2 isopentenyl-diphosphate Delta-isomerase [Chloroflexota bacterium]|nr:type 2 isopentenyl-diphosphate Delta-isomerase [Chloroflexota bacterium]